MTRSLRFNRLIGAPLLALALAPAAVGASSFSLYGSVWDTNDLGKAAGAGFTVAIPLASTGLDLDLRAAYYEELKDTHFEQVIDLTRDDVINPLVEDGIQVTPIELGLKYNFAADSPFNVYLGGGAGYYLLDNTGEQALDDEFGYYAVAGFTAGSSRVAFIGEVVYRQIEGSVERRSIRLDNLGDVDFESVPDLDLNGPTLNLGVTFRF